MAAEPGPRRGVGLQGRRRKPEVNVNDRKLRVVGATEVYDLGRQPESVAERAQRLHHEAQMLAAEQVDELRASLARAVSQSEAIRDGGDIFPVGVREQARQLSASLPLVIDTLQALAERRVREITGAPIPPIWKGD